MAIFKIMKDRGDQVDRPSISKTAMRRILDNRDREIAHHRHNSDLWKIVAEDERKINRLLKLRIEKQKLQIIMIGVAGVISTIIGVMLG